MMTGKSLSGTIVSKSETIMRDRSCQSVLEPVLQHCGRGCGISQVPWPRGCRWSCSARLIQRRRCCSRPRRSPSSCPQDPWLGLVRGLRMHRCGDTTKMRQSRFSGMSLAACMHFVQPCAPSESSHRPPFGSPILFPSADCRPPLVTASQRGLFGFRARRHCRHCGEEPGQMRSNACVVAPS